MKKAANKEEQGKLLARRRLAIRLSRENLRLNDFGGSFVVHRAEVVNNKVTDVNLGIWLT